MVVSTRLLFSFFMNWEDEEGFRGAQKQTYVYVTKTGGKLYQKYIPFPVSAVFLRLVDEYS